MQRRQKVTLEDELQDIQFERAKLEQKVHSIKQRQITDEVRLEQNLKSELENKKLTIHHV